VFGKHNINFKWTTALGVDISNKNKAYIMNKAACVSATFTLLATQTLTYRDNAANTAYTLPEIVTNPADCRTIMEYQISGFTAISSNFDTTALSTAMTAPVLTINKFTDSYMNRLTQDGYLYLALQGGSSFEAVGQKWDFKIYHEDPACDSGFDTTVVAPAETTKSLS
jgi:hypothetical protein